MPPEAPPPAAGPSGGRAAVLVALGTALGLGIGWVAWGGPGRVDGEAPAGAGANPGTTIVAGVDVTNDPVLGPADAPVTIVEFSDFECPFCTRFARQTAPLLRRQYGERIRWIFVNLPLRAIHPRAYGAALAGECATEQDKFWSFYDTMFGGGFDLSDGGLAAAAEAIGLDTERFGQCYENADYAAEVAADEQEARKFYILGTPTFFINGHRLEGAQPPEVFAAVIDSLLAGS